MFCLSNICYEDWIKRGFIFHCFWWKLLLWFQKAVYDPEQSRCLDKCWNTIFYIKGSLCWGEKKKFLNITHLWVHSPKRLKKLEKYNWDCTSAFSPASERDTYCTVFLNKKKKSSLDLFTQSSTNWASQLLFCFSR